MKYLLIILAFVFSFKSYAQTYDVFSATGVKLGTTEGFTADGGLNLNMALDLKGHIYSGYYGVNKIDLFNSASVYASVYYTTTDCSGPLYYTNSYYFRDNNNNMSLTDYINGVSNHPDFIVGYQDNDTDFYVTKKGVAPIHALRGSYISGGLCQVYNSPYKHLLYEIEVTSDQDITDSFEAVPYNGGYLNYLKLPVYIEGHPFPDTEYGSGSN